LSPKIKENSLDFEEEASNLQCLPVVNPFPKKILALYLKKIGSLISLALLKKILVKIRQIDR
jgi:hypothetical protein